MTATSAPPRGWGLLTVLSGNMVLDALEVSLAMVALPAIRADLGLAATTVVWVVAGFALGFGGMLLAGRRLVDRLGRRRAYLAALLGFVATSVLGALASAPALLVATRLVKGCCVALTAPTGLAIIGRTFAEGRSRTRAVSVYSLFGASGFTVGLVLSGALTEAGWRVTFLFPAPVAFALFVAGLWFIPRDEATSGHDAPSRSQRLLTGPLLRAMLGAATLNGSFWGLLYLMTLRAQEELGWSPLRAALALLPASLLLTLAMPVSGRLVARFGPVPLIALGAAAAAVACLLYVRSPPPAGYVRDFLPSLLLVGLAYLLAFAALHVQAVASAVPATQACVSAWYQASVQLGGVLVLVLTAWFSGVVLVVAGVLGLAVALSGISPQRRKR